MSVKHPIVAVTGSSGAGTTTVQHAFKDIFRREGINAVFVNGNSFRRYDRVKMKHVVQESVTAGKPISHFGPEANLFEELETLFHEYSKTGTGKLRHYVQDDEAGIYDQEPGTFTPWSPVPEEADLLFYEGLHGGVCSASWTRRRNGSVQTSGTRERRGKAAGVNVARWVDLLIGVVPIVNLEWIQKIHRDCHKKGCSAEAVTATILRRMHDYVHFIVPQFSLTDINFQRIPLVDTSNPFVTREIPTADESMVVIHFREPKKQNFPYLLNKIDGSFMSRPSTLVAPGGKMGFALELICTPIIHQMLEQKHRERVTA